MQEFARHVAMVKRKIACSNAGWEARSYLIAIPARWAPVSRWYLARAPMSMHPETRRLGDLKTGELRNSVNGQDPG